MYVDFSIYEVDGVLPDWVEDFIRWQPKLEEALEYSHGTFNIIDIADLLANGAAKLWVVDTAAVVTQVVHYPRKIVLHAFLAGGELDGVLEIEKQVHRWAKINGCHAITLNGRPGWSRSPLQSIGYGCGTVQMSKEI
ncbi:MAG: hypothetical protein ACO3AG_00650 [Fluviibacter sp.]